MSSLLLFLLLVQTALEGAEQGILYSRKGAEAFPWDEHRIFIARRASIVAIVILMFWWGNDLLSLLLTIGSYLLMFSLAHNETYYFTRSRIDKKPYRYGYQSPTTTAKFDLSGRVRTILAGVGLLIHIVLIINR